MLDSGILRLFDTVLSTLSGWSTVPYDSVNQIASKFEIPYASTDWKQSLEDLRPTIVAADFVPNKDALEQIEWAEVNAEWSYTAMIELNSPYASKSISALFKHSGLQTRFHDDHIVIDGESGAILMRVVIHRVTFTSTRPKAVGKKRKCQNPLFKNCLATSQIIPNAIGRIKARICCRYL